jgi:YD repeat-containing protein
MTRTLTTVTGPSGHTLQFQYDSAGKLQRVVTPSQHNIDFGYANGNLTSVQYPDGTSRTYHYEDATLTGFLTGVTDESGARFSTFAYDSAGRVTLSKHGTNVQQYTFVYSPTATTVTDPLGAAETLSFDTQWGKPRKITQSSRNGLTKSYSVLNPGQDFNRRASQTTDPNGVVSTFGYSGIHLTSKTEAVGTPAARTTTYAYLEDATNLPTLITEPNRTTAFAYNAARNVLTKTVTDTTVVPNVSRTWTFTYDANGRVLTEDGPRTDVNDVTTYTYYTCTTGAQCGQLHTITNALSQTTTFNTYNAHGQPLTITDANGVVTTLTYDLRQRLTSRAAGGETTTFEYWPTGLLKKTTLPDSSYVLYTYDIAHRLTRIDDGDGNRIEYTLDGAGNRTAESSYDPSNALARSRTQVFNVLGQLWKQVGSAGTSAVTTTFGYDNNENQTSTAAPLGRNTSQLYDELNRLKQITDPGSGVTQFAYDANDNLTTVTDPKTNVTTYTYNGFGDVTQTVSPDTGTTASMYDSGGNLATTTDARSKQGSYAYDALNRVTSVTYPDRALSFTYDAERTARGG